MACEAIGPMHREVNREIGIGWKKMRGGGYVVNILLRYNKGKKYWKPSRVAKLLQKNPGMKIVLCRKGGMDKTERMGFRPDVAYRRIQELEEFIRNGVEFGYISVPEKGDKAREIVESIMQSRVK